ncbi:TetR family transcriptional regulator [Mycolicibacterium sp. CBM1]
MKRQARAEVTRQKITDAAVELFADIGYGETGLADIVKSAGITKGAFYYHFASKEVVAEAIMSESNARVVKAYAAATRDAGRELERLIAGTFAIAAEIRSDRLVGVGNLLVQALSQISNAGSRSYPEWKDAFIEQARRAAAASELRDDIDADDAGEAIFVAMVGCQLVSDAIGDDPFSRLARAWRVLLRAVAAPPALPALEAALVSVRESYQSAG